MPYLTPDAPTSDVVLRAVVPNTLMPSVVGALASLWNPYHWEEDGALTVPETLEYVGEVIASVTEGPNIGACPCRVIVPVPNYSANLGTPSKNWQTASDYGVDIASANINPNYLEWTITIPEGTYRIDIWGHKQSNHGITSLRVDGVEVGTYDSYSAQSTWDNLRQISDVVIAGNDPHVIQAYCSSRHASATGFIQSFSNMELVRTG